jgi:arylsulfatase A-like enzyme
MGVRPWWRFATLDRGSDGLLRRVGLATLAMLWALVALAPGGCSRAAPSGPVTDLVAMLPDAEVWCETAEIDLGTSRPEPALLGGWGAPSWEAAGYLWGAGERSELEFRRADASAFRLRMRGWAHPRLPEGQDVDIAVNGVALPRIRLGSAPQSVEVEVPEGQAWPGRNRLALTYPVVVPTGRHGRLFGPAWDGLRFGNPRAAATPLPAASPTGALELSAGCGVDFLLELPGVARLHLAGVEERSGARLEADVACEDSPVRYGGLGRSRRGERELMLREAGGAAVPCRVTLRAVSDKPPSSSPFAAGLGGVRIATAGFSIEPPTTAAALPAGAATTSASPSAPSSPPSFVIYLVDALRADRLGSYGGPPGLTPALDRFATEAVQFAQARAQSSWTRPAVASLFTGLTPLRHGATGFDSRLPEEVSTLAERLRERGYRTGYITANSNTTEAFGFGQGFDTFRWLHGGGEHSKARWREVHAAAREFFDDLSPETPYLLVLHTVETHAPYHPSPMHRGRWAPSADPRLGDRKTLAGLPSREPGEEVMRQVGELYNAEVADADEGFADLVAELERRGRRGDTSILFLSDHGEELFDHGNVEHGRTLYEEQLRVPMLWSLPRHPGAAGTAGVAGRRGRQVTVAIDQIDVLPTLLEIAGAPLAADLPGRSFAAALRGGDPPAPRSSAAWLDRLSFRQEAVVSGDHKLIRNLRASTATAIATDELFELGADPGELEPLGEERELRRALLAVELRRWRALAGAPLAAETAAIDDRLRRELQALGYLQ